MYKAKQVEVTDFDEYRCSACRKSISETVAKCTVCTDTKLFFHPGCVFKHKVYDKNEEPVTCKGPFEKFELKKIDMQQARVPERERRGSFSGNSGMKTPTAAASKVDSSKERKGSISGNKELSAPTAAAMKIDWIITTVKEMKDEMACRNEIKEIITNIVREEMESVKKEIEGLKRMMQQGEVRSQIPAVRETYSQVVKENKKEKVIIIKPNVQQESDATKKAIKERVDIKSMAVGITKLRKGNKGTVILGCETGEEMESLKATVQDKMGEEFKVTEPAQIKPKIKIVNIDEDEMQLEDGKLIETIRIQNEIDSNQDCEMTILKRIMNKGQKEQNKPGRSREEGSIILEVDERTHEILLNKGKLSVGWKKCKAFNHLNVKRCYKCWGFYHIAKKCTREEKCSKCAGNHNIKECKAAKSRCVNCMFKNQKYNLKINEEHDALDRECPTYKRTMQEEKRRAGWAD